MCIKACVVWSNESSKFEREKFWETILQGSLAWTAAILIPRKVPKSNIKCSLASGIGFYASRQINEVHDLQKIRKQFFNWDSIFVRYLAKIPTQKSWKVVFLPIPWNLCLSGDRFRRSDNISSPTSDISLQSVPLSHDHHHLGVTVIAINIFVITIIRSCSNRKVNQKFQEIILLVFWNFWNCPVCIERE